MSVRKDERTGKFIATVECGDINGKRKRKQKSFAQKKEALRWEREMQDAAENTDISKYDITLEKLAKEYLAYKKDRELAYATIRKYENAVRVLGEYNIFKRRVRDIHMADIEYVLNDFGATHTANYVRIIKAVLSSIITYGIDQDYLVKNPCKRAAMPKHTKESRSNIDSFTKEEVAIIESHKDDIPFGDIIYLMLNTGLRSQEVCAIDRDSLIYKEGKPYLRIDKAMKLNNTGAWEKSEPKTLTSIRDIPISETVKSIILKNLMRNGNSLVCGYLEPISYSGFYAQYRDFFKELIDKKEDVRLLPPHCCRHTFASRCEWSGISPLVTKELLGHSEVTMTHKYTHVMDDAKEEAIRNII